LGLPFSFSLDNKLTSFV